MAGRKVKTGASKPVVAKVAAPAAREPGAAPKSAAPKAEASAKIAPKLETPVKADVKPKVEAPAKPAAQAQAAAPVKPAAPLKAEAPKPELPVQFGTPVAPAVTEAKVEAALALPEAVAKAPVEIAKTQVQAGRAAAETIQTNVKEGTKTMNKQINDTIELNREAGKAAADKIQAAFGDVNERTKTAMEKSARLVEEMTEISRGNVEAFVASSKVAARGVESLTQEAADFSRRSFEEASSTLKSFAEVKSPTDFFRLQSDFARAQFDAMVAETSKVSERMLKLAGEVAEPITSRYTVAAERVKTIAL